MEFKGAGGVDQARAGLKSDVRHLSSDFEPKIGAGQGRQPVNGRDAAPFEPILLADPPRHR